MAFPMFSGAFLPLVFSLKKHWGSGLFFFSTGQRCAEGERGREKNRRQKKERRNEADEKKKRTQREGTGERGTSLELYWNVLTYLPSFFAHLELCVNIKNADVTLSTGIGQDVPHMGAIDCRKRNEMTQLPHKTKTNVSGGDVARWCKTNNIINTGSKNRRHFLRIVRPGIR